MTCRFCPKNFVETMNGLVEKTFHELLHEAETINEAKIINEE